MIELQANFTLISKSWILVCTAAIDTMGEQYWGTVNVTINNRTCQRWETTSPHSHGFLDLEVYNVSVQLTLLINLIFNVKCTFGYNESVFAKTYNFYWFYAIFVLKIQGPDKIESCLGALNKAIKLNRNIGENKFCERKKQVAM